jgi:hypothetical protein
MAYTPPPNVGQRPAKQTFQVPVIGPYGQLTLVEVEADTATEAQVRALDTAPAGASALVAKPHPIPKGH